MKNDRWSHALSTYSNSFIDQFNQSQVNSGLIQQISLSKELDFNFDIDHYLYLLYCSQQQLKHSEKDSNNVIISEKLKSEVCITDGCQSKENIQSSSSMNNCDYSFQTQLNKISDQNNNSNLMFAEKLMKQSSQSSIYLSFASKDTILTLPTSPQRYVDDSNSNKKNHLLFKIIKLKMKSTPHKKKKVVFLNIKRSQFLKKMRPSFVTPRFKLLKTELKEDVDFKVN